MKDSRSYRTYAAIVAATTLLLPSASCIIPFVFVDCDEDYGVCPPPEVGVVVDSGRIEKRVWAERESVGAPGEQVPFEFRPNVCSAELDASNGLEVLLNGQHGVAILANEPAEPTLLATVADPDPTDFLRPLRFVDVDGDGNVEYLRQSATTATGESRYLVLTHHDGTRRWERAIDMHTVLLRYSEGDWAAADIDGDGTLEFAVTTADGVQLFDADGNDLSVIGDEFYAHIAFGNVTGDDELELITFRQRTTRTWSLDGTLLASFTRGEDESWWYGDIARVTPDDALDRLRLGCGLYDAEGNRVAIVAPGDRNRCDGSDVSSMAEFEVEPCPMQEETHSVERMVRFDASAEPYRIEASYSYRSTLRFAGFGTSTATRCILKIFDGAGALVYHEVINSASAPGSLVVIPSDVEGAELLLVGDDTRILAYQLRESGAVE